VVSNEPPRFVPHQVIVRFRTGTPAPRQQALLEAAAPRVRTFRRPGVRKAQLHAAFAQAQGAELLDHLAVVELEDRADLTASIRRFERAPEVLYAEPNYLLRLSQVLPQERVPNDFEFGLQWGLRNGGDNGGRAGADIGVARAWQRTTGDPGIKVAVIDTGIDYFHPDLEANVWINPREIPGNGLDDDGNGYIDDVHGYDFVSDDSDSMDDQTHGTHVAGIIGAVGDNAAGVSGVCWRTTLLAIKAFDERGDGAVSDVVAALGYATANGARIINASWGLAERSRALEEAINAAHALGVLIVASAGNNRSGTVSYPAALPATLAVAATNAKDERASFSNFGSLVALAAPGENVYSTTPNNAYDFLSGTSMSAPHVTGVAALVLAQHPEFTNVQVEAILRNTTDPLQADQYIGSGRLNAWKALAVETPLPSVKLLLPEVIFGRISIHGTASGEHFASYMLEYGQGTYPTNWALLHQASTPVQDGNLLEDYSTAALAEGSYVIRLTVLDTLGQQAADRAVVTVKNVQLLSPLHNDVLRAGEPVTILGTVFGPGRTYRVEWGLGWKPASWSSDGITLAAGGEEEVVGGKLADWDTSRAPTNEFVCVRLTAQAEGQPVGESRAYLVYLSGALRPGWPQHLPIEGDYSTNDWRGVTVADLDHDGFAEILRVDPGNSDGKPARLLVYGHDGAVRWSRVLDSGEPYSDVPTVGDIDHDGFQEVFVDAGAKGQLWAFRHDGTPLGGNWPAQLEARNLGKVLADLDGDGTPELIAYAQDAARIGSTDYRQLLVFDATGRLLRRWDLPACEDSLDAPKMFPAVGNLDADPDLEIVAVWGCGSIAAFSLKKPEGPLWKASTEGTLFGSPAIGDVDHDGKNEIVVGAYDLRAATKAGTHGGVYLFDGQGRRLPGWPVLVEESFAATPALADLDGDGELEIAIPSWSPQKLHLLHANGFETAPWPLGPFNRTQVRSSAVLGDIDGDGRPDVVLVSPGQFLLTATGGDFSAVGGVRAWRADGQPIDLNPKPELLPLVMESGGGSTRLKNWPVTLTDLDRNGKLDVVAVSIDDPAYSPEPPRTGRKRRYSLYAWELETPYVATNMVWSMFQRDPQHTGYLPPPPKQHQPPAVSGLPDQTVRAGSAFFPIGLDQYVQDPEFKPSELSWRAEGNQRLEVSIGADHIALVRPPDGNWTGLETLRFIATNPYGLSGEATATYAVRLDYDPPVAREDRVSTPEDQPVELDVLANDTEPHGQPLMVMGLSHPSHGQAVLTPTGAVRYSPAPDFNGPDAFTYLLSNGQDGMALGTVEVKVLPVEDPPHAEADYGITLENTPISLDVLENDSDPDGDPLAIVGFTQPRNGSVVSPGDGTLLYTPAPLTHGLDRFTYRISDGHGGQSEAEVTVMVKPVNLPPTARDQAFTLNRNTHQDITFLATDPDGDDPTFKVVASPAHGTLWTYPKVATYYPAKGYSGPDSFTYQASDGELDSQVATVSFTVLDRNNAPRAEDQSLRCKVGKSRLLTLQATDDDDDAVTCQILRPPAHGTLSLTGTNYLYTPTPDYLGEDSFTFSARDALEAGPEATVSITVTDQNTAPVARDGSVEVKLNTPTLLWLEAEDPEGDSLVFTLLSTPLHGLLRGEAPQLTYTPGTNYSGPDRLTFKVSDGELESKVATVTLPVVFPNHPPTTRDQFLSVARGQPSALRLEIGDVDGDVLRAAILKGPASGRITGLGTNLVYTPKAGFVGNDSFTYKVWDGHIYSQVTKVSLLVAAVVPPPKPAFNSIERLEDNSVALSLTASAGKLLLIQVSTNLTTWTTIHSETPEASAVNVTDRETAGAVARFYRATLP